MEKKKSPELLAFSDPQKKLLALKWEEIYVVIAA